MWYCVSGEVLSTLDSVSGRKHPSTVQIKQLRQVLPMTAILQHLVSSQVIKNKDFLLRASLNY